MRRPEASYGGAWSVMKQVAECCPVFAHTVMPNWVEKYSHYACCQRPKAHQTAEDKFKLEEWDNQTAILAMAEQSSASTPTN